jgi:hypothetical protein
VEEGRQPARYRSDANRLLKRFARGQIEEPLSPTSPGWAFDMLVGVHEC